MPRSKRVAYMTVDEYLANEDRSTVKHEYVGGHIYAMTGTTRRHNIIAGNLHSLLRAHVRGGPCRVYMVDVKVRVEATNCFYYPDVMVSCDAFDSKSVFTDSPTLLIEVLSPSTASIDRREKLSAYQQIPSLKEYAIVHQKTKRVILYRKTEQELWNMTELNAGEELVLTSISGTPITMTIDQIYEDAGFTDGEETHLEVRERSDQECSDANDLDW